jgi:hypothetical protein
MLEDKETHGTSQTTDSVDGGLAKKSYQSPQLRIYGNIREVTQGPGNRVNRDFQHSGAGFKSLP